MLFNKEQQLARMQARATTEAGKAILAGFLIHETYKNDTEYQNLVNLDRQLKSMFDIIQQWQDYITKDLMPKSKTGEGTASTTKLIDYYNEKINALAIEYNQARNYLTSLPNDFGYSIFNKVLFLR